ncbi:TetR-like C-terminal domain-containing protein [Lacrimispora sp. BS-2]|uniref:TetR-like C-terminal domain-containing protein n=1 Tax=Lacrimispora sp. BS-2 TaxID=3151850 RepID=A0AAU7PV68_9FIRM
MAQLLTKKMIREVFVQMLSERPLHKITVTDVVTACKINRNTFYYYYADLYGIISEIFQTELQKVIDDYYDTNSWEESLLQALKFAIENKKAVYHIYNSIQKEKLEKYLFDVSGNAMKRYVEKIMINLDIRASHTDINIIILFYQYALTEMLINWVSSGMSMEQENIIRRCGQLFNGNIERSLRKSVELNNNW